MDYEQKYKEALERAKGIMRGECETAFVYSPTLFGYLFPELAESEDERIRKKIIATINLYYGEPLEDEAKEMISWLEKQGEKDRIEWSKEDERLCQCLIQDQEKALDDVRNDKYGHSEIISDLKEMYRERINWLESLKEKLKRG